jgi:hypothetical protein
MILTLNEKQLINDSNFLINFYSNADKVDNLFYLSGDTSPNPNRWNEFPITGTGITDLMEGQYDYYVYETITTVLAISATTGNIVESGKAVVIGSGSTTPFLSNELTQYTFE